MCVWEQSRRQGSSEARQRLRETSAAHVHQYCSNARSFTYLRCPGVPGKARGCLRPVPAAARQHAIVRQQRAMDPSPPKTCTDNFVRTPQSQVNIQAYLGKTFNRRGVFGEFRCWSHGSSASSSACSTALPMTRVRKRTLSSCDDYTETPVQVIEY